MDCRRRNEIDTEISVLMSRYMDMYNTDALRVTINAARNPFRFKIEVTEFHTL